MDNKDHIKDLRKIVGHQPLQVVGVWLLIKNKNNEVLMQLRTDFNSWDFPGGIVELGEKIEDAAKRELKEETNLEINKLNVLEIFSGDDIYRKYPNGDELYVISVLCEVKEYFGELRINDGESKILKWVKINEIPQNLSPVAKKNIDKIKKYLN